MKMRIVLIIALVAGLAVTGLNLVQVRGKITRLQTNLKQQTAARAQSESDLAKTRSDMERTVATLRQTSSDLELTKTENRALSAKAEAQAKRAEQLKDDLALTREKYDVARISLSAYESMLSLKEATVASKRIKELELQIDVLTEEKMMLVRSVQRNPRIDRGCYVPLPDNLTGTVVSYDPKWRFVVLDAGEKQGVLENCELLVSRQGKLVGKVVVRDVKKDSSVANVVPGWELAEIKEGDRFITAQMPRF